MMMVTNLERKIGMIQARNITLRLGKKALL